MSKTPSWLEDLNYSNDAFKMPGDLGQPVVEYDSFTEVENPCCGWAKSPTDILKDMVIERDNKILSLEKDKLELQTVIGTQANHVTDLASELNTARLCELDNLRFIQSASEYAGNMVLKARIEQVVRLLAEGD